MLSFDEDFYIGVIWSGNKWVYASDNAELVSGIANWKKGKDTGKSNETCVKLKYKGTVRSLEVNRGQLRSGDIILKRGMGAIQVR